MPCLEKNEEPASGSARNHEMQFGHGVLAEAAISEQESDSGLKVCVLWVDECIFETIMG